jgi:hypothetical protein
LAQGTTNDYGNLRALWAIVERVGLVEAIGIRPTWNRKEPRIKLHAFMCNVAYVLISPIQLPARKVEPGNSGLRALEEIARLAWRMDRGLPAPRGGRRLLRGMFGGES